MQFSVARVAAVTMSVVMMAGLTGCGISSEGTNEALENLSSTLETVEANLASAKEKAKEAVEVLRNNGVDVDAIVALADDVKVKANEQIDELGARQYFDAIDTEMTIIQECYEKVKNASGSTKSYAESETAKLYQQLSNSNVDMDFSYVTVKDSAPDNLYIFNYQSDVSNHLTYAYATQIDFNNIDISSLVSPYCIVRSTSGAVVCNKFTKTQHSVDESDEISAAMTRHNMSIVNAEGLIGMMGSEFEYVSSVLNAVVDSDTFSMDTFVNPNSGVYYTFVYDESVLKYIITEEENQWGVFMISNLSYGDAADISDTTLLSKCS